MLFGYLGVQLVLSYFISGWVKVVNPDLHKGDPYGPLLEKKAKIDGRNNAGRICVRHRGGAHKRRYRVIDFKRDKDGIPGKI